MTTSKEQALEELRGRVLQESLKTEGRFIFLYLISNIKGAALVCSVFLQLVSQPHQMI